MIKALSRTDVPGFTNSSISIFMTFITAKFFQTIFFSLQEARRHFPPWGRRVHAWPGLLPSTLSSPSSLLIHHEQELCSFPRGYSGDQAWAALALQSCVPPFTRGIWCKTSVLRVWFSSDHSYGASPRNLIVPHQITASKALHKISSCWPRHTPSSPIRVTPDHHYHDKSRATSPNLEANPALSQGLHERPARSFLPKLL